MNRSSTVRHQGFSLVEGLIFGAIAMLVMGSIVALMFRGGKLVELSRRTSASQTDLKIVLETLTEDVAELVYLDGTVDVYDGSLKFVVRSTRAESGLPAPAGGAAGLRKIEYKLQGSGKLKDCVRTVTAVSGGGGSSARTLVRSGIARLKAWPIVAAPQGNGKYKLVAPGNGTADDAGATVACLVVDVSAGEAAGDVEMEKQTVTSIVTKLWCRNRVMELSRGALQ